MLTILMRRMASFGLIATIMTGAAVQAGSATFTDDFEGSTLNPFWSSSVSSGSIVFPSTSTVHGGSQSVQFSSFNSFQSKGIQLSHTFATPTYGTVSIWMFDTGAGQSSSNWMNFNAYNNNYTASQILVYDYGFAGGGPGRGDQYDVGDGSYLNATGITRSAAWHQFTIDSTPQSFSFYVDGIQVRTRSGGTPLEQVTFGMGGPSWRPAWTTSFDDFSFQQYSSIPEPSSLVTMGIGSTVLLAAWYRRRLLACRR